MKVSLRWLQDYVDLPTTDVAEIKRAFDMLGHAVEEVTHFTADWSDVVVGKVLSVEAHPDADRIRVTTVDTGNSDPYQIICGAWNFEAGAVVPVALPGAVLPGDFKIERRKIRGVESNGMICSAKELGLGEEADGIMVLADETPIGVPFSDLLELPDVVFDLEITNNRPDVMGMLGVARELAAWFDVPYRLPEADLDTVPGETGVAVTISAPDGCNRFTAREMREVTVAESPLWMQDRLRKAGVRPISNVVDVTNYVMLELGHPLHAFDAATIVGDALEVRWAQPGETLETLDGSQRALTEKDLVIVDDAGPTSLAAVMGGLRSEVTHTTTRVLMEAASWDAPTVMYASRRHDLRSEASARFERGVDRNLAPLANDRACHLLAQISGARPVAHGIDVVANSLEPWHVRLRTATVQGMLGEGFDTARSTALLERLDLDVESTDTEMTVTVPTNRADLTRPADLIEEIARLADFDTFPATVPTGPAGGLSPEQRRQRQVVELLRGLGLNQVINLPFVSPDELSAFRPDATEVVKVRNPLREDQALLRQSLLPAMLRNVRDNLNRGSGRAALFEIGRVFFARPWAEDERVPDQPTRLAFVIAGGIGPAQMGAVGDTADAATSLAVIDALTRRLGAPIDRRPAQPDGYHPTRTALLTLDGHDIGFAGELHPDVAEAFDIVGRVAVAELDVGPLLAARHANLMTPVSTYPHSDFDLSFMVAPSLAGGDLVAQMRESSELVERVAVFDDYRDPESGTRSLGLTVRLRSAERTLGRQEIDKVRGEMIARAAAMGAALKGAS